MKAVICPRYGPPEVLQIREIDRPEPKRNEVSIKVYAAGVFAGDCEMRAFRFSPAFWIPLRLILGVFRPRRPVFGQEVAGEIVSVGSDVTGFDVGDHVMAGTGGFGGYAQYVCLSDRVAIAHKPPALPFSEAAVVPVGGQNALHFVRKAAIRPGDRVLIYGACGGIGTFAVQLSKHEGAEVTAVDRADKRDVLRNIGADHVLDYVREDFTSRTEFYDVIIDVVGKSNFSRSLRSLKPDGRYVLANPNASSILKGLWASMTGSRKVLFEMAKESRADLEVLRGLAAEGKIRVVVDRRFPMEQAADAHRYIDSGRKKGCVVLMMEGEPEA